MKCSITFLTKGLGGEKNLFMVRDMSAKVNSLLLRDLHTLVFSRAATMFLCARHQVSMKHIHSSFLRTGLAEVENISRYRLDYLVFT
mmetsp:Transcript_22381/g.34152  ORF Transcript_22381/g.34152 Transcript_22381/m.34152 type:complete len:87 (+) Transcript_22381:477-737(+)